MKCTATREEPTFNPITVTLTLETQQEVNALAQLFNLHSLHNVMDELGSDFPHYSLLEPYATTLENKVLGDKLRDALKKIH